MELEHNGMTFKMPDEWLAEADVLAFEPYGASYVADSKGREVKLLPVTYIDPIRRDPLFRDNEHSTARNTVVTFLRSMAAGQPVKPVTVIRSYFDGPPYRMRNGTHRLYSAISLGFLNVPAVMGYDPNV